MKHIKRTSATVIGGLLLFGTAACGSSYDREEYITEFQEESGLSAEQATCVVNRLEAEIGAERLGERGDLTAEETAIVEAAALECFGLGG